VVALLPEAEELKLLGLESKWHTCVLTSPENGKVVAAVDELEGTMFKVINFSFTAPRSYTKPDRCKASLLLTPGGNMLGGRTYERSGVQYVSGLRHFVLVTTNCFRTREDAVTEWEVLFVTFDKESKNSHSIKVVEQAFFLTMPMTLRARYTLRGKMVNPLPGYEEVLAEISKKVEGIDDDEARKKFSPFIPAIAVTYIRAFGGEAEMPERETPEVIEEQPVEQPVFLAATGTDDPVPFVDDVDTSIADQQADAMAAEKEAKQRRGKKPNNKKK
jgi:hypothetical protein